MLTPVSPGKHVPTKGTPSIKQQQLQQQQQMLATRSQATTASISLHGSVQIITEFLDYSINSILFQRGLYPAEDFQRIKTKHGGGVTVMQTTDVALKRYLDTLFQQLTVWLLAGSVQKVVLVIQEIATKEVMERWTFDIHCQQATTSSPSPTAEPHSPSGTEEPHLRENRQVHAEMQAIIRQITASVTFLPILESKCTFNLLVYADKQARVPTEWIDSDPKYIRNSEQVRLRSFSTGLHSVDTFVCYKYEDGLDLC